MTFLYGRASPGLTHTQKRKKKRRELLNKYPPTNQNILKGQGSNRPERKRRRKRQHRYRYGRRQLESEAKGEGVLDKSPSLNGHRP